MLFHFLDELEVVEEDIILSIHYIDYKKAEIILS